MRSMTFGVSPLSTLSPLARILKVRVRSSASHSAPKRSWDFLLKTTASMVVNDNSVKGRAILFYSYYVLEALSQSFVVKS